MEHYPVYLSLRDKRVLVVGTGECALAKLRLLMKTPARIEVYGFDPIDDLIALSAAGHIHLMHRKLDANDLTIAQLVYAAQEDDALDHAVAQLAREHGVLVNIVDNLRHSDFITKNLSLEHNQVYQQLRCPWLYLRRSDESILHQLQ